MGGRRFPPVIPGGTKRATLLGMRLVQLGLGLGMVGALAIACDEQLEQRAGPDGGGAVGGGPGADAGLGLGGSFGGGPIMDEPTGQWTEQAQAAQQALAPDQVAGCEQMTGHGSEVDVSVAESGGFASPAVAGELMRAEVAPIPQLLRVQDFLNYYAEPSADTGLLVPGSASAPTVLTQLRQVAGNQFDLLVLVHAPSVPPPDKQHVVLIIDDTLSMGDAQDPGSPLARAKQVAHAIASHLPSEARLSLRTVGGVSPSSIDEVSGVDGEASITDALATVLQDPTLVLGAGDRAFLLSDGKDDPARIPATVLSELTAQGARLSAISVGAATELPDRFFRALARTGGGHFVHAGSSQEVEYVGAMVPEMLSVALYDVSVSLQLPWHFTLTRGAEQELTTSFDPDAATDLSSDGVQVFLFRLQTCSEELAHTSSTEPLSVVVKYKTTAWGNVESTEPSSTTSPELFDASKPALEAQRLRAVMTVAEALRALDRAQLQSAKAELQEVSKSLPAQSPLVQLNEALASHPLLL